MTPLRPWDALAADVVVDNPWVRLRRDTVRLPSGRVVDDFFVTEQADVVLVFALTEAEQVVLVRQWRQGRRGFFRELPGGLLDPGETPAGAAARELREETGYACAELRELGRFGMDPTRTTSAIVAFLGLAARVESAPLADEQEEIEVGLVPLGELVPLIHAGEISSAGTVATIYRALDELGRRPGA